VDRQAKWIVAGTPLSRVAAAAEEIAGEAIAEIEASLPRALAGDREQVSLYVAAYGRLTDQLLDALADDKELEAVPWVKTVLRNEAMSAPFTYWVGRLGPGQGTALAAVELLRGMLPKGKPLPRPAERRLPVWNIDEGDVVRFYRAVAVSLEGEESPIEVVRKVLGLSRTEFAALFGVRRQALDGWERKGLPAERQTKLAAISGIADLLAKQLKPERIPAVVRRPAPAYGGRSILEGIAAGKEDEILVALRDGFDWASGL
jgi:transcriptional regulator with XRE-family HTH domain